jgi:transcriptional regulator with XRE-family HTH domain
MEKKFHEILKEARLNAGLTQSQLAEKIGVAKSTYCNWEQGTREPNVLKLKAIAKALGVTGDYLLGMEEPNIIHKAQNKYGQERLLAYIDALNKLTDEDAQ